MTRTTTWLSTLSCAVILAACSVGCGSSGPANNTGKAGHGGNAGGGAGAGGTGTAGSGSTAGAGGGTAGDNGTAGAGGSAAGTAGSGGSAGGTAGAAGGTAGAAGGTAGAGGGTAGAGGGTAGGTAGTGNNDGGNMDSKSDTAEVAQIMCVAGGDCTGAPANFTCTITRTCRRNQEQDCYCDPNNKIACEACDTIDAGTDAGMDAGVDSGTDAGSAIPACPGNINSFNTMCDNAGDRCTMGTCNTTTHRQAACACLPFSATNNRWVCGGGFSVMCQ
jgi:hypothetical protein